MRGSLEDVGDPQTAESPQSVTPAWMITPLSHADGNPSSANLYLLCIPELPQTMRSGGCRKKWQASQLSIRSRPRAGTPVPIKMVMALMLEDRNPQ